MACGEEQTQRVARQALENLVKIREDKVLRLERRISLLENHVHNLVQTYSGPAFPPGFDPSPVKHTEQNESEQDPPGLDTPLVIRKRQMESEQLGVPHRYDTSLVLHKRQKESEQVEGPPGYDPSFVNYKHPIVGLQSENFERDAAVATIDAEEELKDEKRLPFSYVGRQRTLDSFFQRQSDVVDQQHDATVSVPAPYVMARREGCPEKAIIVVPGKASPKLGESDQVNMTGVKRTRCGFEESDQAKRRAVERIVESSGVANIGTQALRATDVSGVSSQPVVTWRPTARAADSSSSSGSSAISDSTAVSGSTSEQGEEYDEVSKDGRDAKGITQPLGQAVKERTVLLSPDTPEDCFDWAVLGALSSIIWPGRFSNCHQRRVETVLPLRYSHETHYAAAFQPLIMEECKAIFESDWEKVMKEFGLRRSSSGYRLPSVRACSSVWFLQHLPSQDEPFCSFQGHQQSGPPAEHCEILLLASRQTLELKALAIVQNVFDNEVLMRTREHWDKCPEQCLMLKVSNLVTMKRMYMAVSSLSVLYPSLRSQVLNPSYGNSNTVGPRPAFLSAWEAGGLFNDSQLSAIAAAVNLNQGFLLVQGPPGTGKTATILGMVSALLIKEPGVRILLCAGSNPALDEVVSRLMLGLVDSHGKRQPPSKGVVVRVGPRNKIRKDCLDVYLDHLRLRQKDAPTRALATEWTLKTASVVCSTLSGSRHPQLDDLKFTFDIAIVDEAAQAAEPEAIIALKKVAGRCILVGDPRQLPATVMQQPATAFGRSLFERMQDADAPVHLLRTQYRMHPEISQFPSKQFYNSAVEDADQLHHMEPIFQWRTRHQWVSSGGYDFELGRFCFLDVTWGSHQKDMATSSLLNREEASVVVAIVQGVLKSLTPGVKSKVGVITPYAAQKKTILDELSRIQVDEKMCEVDTVDGFQGREKDVIILSCVRAGGPRNSMGFLSDPRRLCVALTRAKHALVIVGHSRTLEKDHLWRSLIRNAYERNCLKALLKS